MTDPDAPFKDNPTQKYWLHWMVTNIKVFSPPIPPKYSITSKLKFINHILQISQFEKGNVLKKSLIPDDIYVHVYSLNAFKEKLILRLTLSCL